MVDSFFVTCRDHCSQISLSLATTTSVQLVDALYAAGCPKDLVQTIDITLKYSYIFRKQFSPTV